LHPGPGLRPGSWTRCPCCTAWKTAHLPPPRRVRSRRGVPRYRKKMPAHDIEVEEALEEGVTMRWLSTVAQAEAGKLVIEKMKLDETRFPHAHSELGELRAE